MSTISLGRSGIVGISYSETSLLKSNLMRANERRNSASNNINSAKVKLQVNGRSGRIRVETDNLQSYYSSLKSNNSKIEKIIRDIDYIVRKFKEVDSRCASRVRAISRSYKVQSFISKIGNSLISFGNKVFNGISNFIKDGISIIKNIYNSSVSWINSYGFYGSLSSGNFNLGMYPGLAMAGMGVGVTTLGPIIPGGVTNNNKGVEEYLKKSFNQLLLGNFTNDVTALGTVGQVGLGLLGADLPLDIRDISADFINWEWSWKHAGQTALDLLALLPIIGAVKYADEAWIGLKNGFKVIKNSDIINKIGSPLLDSAKAIGAYIKKAPDLIQYFRGGIKNIGDQIDNIGYNIRKVMGFEPELVADGVRIGDIKDIGKLNDIDAPPLNDIQKNYNKIVNGEEGIKGVSNPKSKLYNPVDFNGTVKVNGEVRDVSRRVYQRGDIDINYFDENTGLTNLERMKKGKPPIGSDGNPIQLHHLTQQEAGSMVEILEVTHQEYYSQLHGLVGKGESFRNNPILEKQYNNFRGKYWKWRYEQFTK